MRDLLGSHLLGLIFAAGSTGTAASTPPDNTFKVALVSGAAIVVAAAVTAFAATFQKSRPVEAMIPPSVYDNNEDGELENELRRRAELAEDRVTSQAARITQLERLLYLNHIDPDTGAPL